MTEDDNQGSTGVNIRLKLPENSAGWEARIRAMGFEVTSSSYGPFGGQTHVIYKDGHTITLRQGRASVEANYFDELTPGQEQIVWAIKAAGALLDDIAEFADGRIAQAKAEQDAVDAAKWRDLCAKVYESVNGEGPGFVDIWNGTENMSVQMLGQRKGTATMQMTVTWQVDTEHLDDLNKAGIPPD